MLKVSTMLCLQFQLLYFIKYDLLTEYLALLWSALLVKKFKPVFRVKDCFHLWISFVMSTTDAQIA